LKRRERHLLPDPLAVRDPAICFDEMDIVGARVSQGRLAPAGGNRSNVRPASRGRTRLLGVARRVVMPWITAAIASWCARATASVSK
jgi:hypothetical protein